MQFLSIIVFKNEIIIASLIVLFKC